MHETCTRCLVAPSANLLGRYCRGLTLQAYLTDGGGPSLAEQQVWHVFVQLCSALRYLHQDMQVAPGARDRWP